ncbi:MAG: hypothetical protein WA144_06715 [Candidatus Methanoperedens sp.]
MPPGKRYSKTLIKLILLIAKNDGIELSIITKNKRLSFKNVELLNEMGLLDFGRIGESPKNKIPPGILKFKTDFGTIHAIAQLLDNKELSKLMVTKYYENNLIFYKTELKKSFGEINSASLPDEDYMDYALRNSPSTVCFFLKDNGSTELLKSIYINYIKSSNEHIEKSKIEMMDKHDLHLVWENLIFLKIQEDLKNKLLLKPNNYYTGYLPITKKTLEKLIEWRHSEKIEQKNSFLNVIKSFF